ncbi:hypothetical protein EGW08_021904 [Elysia chlorotica]|uniref:Fibronectin type-III domain-containing protein n=1 Tax=Elysia chlorotica TaxID=188477 RepID=A0A433SMB6_ELYCH|nr:hypothetical protein EGW08_021904 [Elysia chlorotica]
MFQEVEPSVNEDGLFSVVLNVAKKSRYEIQVTPYNSEMEAAPSDPIYFYVSGVPLGVTPEISVTARSLGSDSAVVSYAVLGNLELSSVNIFYKTEDDNKWTQFTKDVVPLRGDEFLVLTGLEPGTVYYIYAKSWLHTSYHVSITTVLIGDGQKTEEIGNLPLSKTENGEGDISIDWSSWNLEDVDGYKVTATLINTSTSISRTVVQYLPSLQTTIEFAAGEDTVDSVTVQPFDFYGLKKGGHILCQTPTTFR